MAARFNAAPASRRFHTNAMADTAPFELDKRCEHALVVALAHRYEQQQQQTLSATTSMLCRVLSLTHTHS